MKLILVALIGLGAMSGNASQVSGLSAGHAYFAGGHFNKAAKQFELACKAGPERPEGCYWAGISHQKLGDIATPFGGSHHAKARAFLRQAMQLAPGRAEYRQALFDELLDSGDGSRASLRQAVEVLETVPQSDPEYNVMRRRLDDAMNAGPSADAILADVFLLAPRVSYRIAETPASVLSKSGERSAERKAERKAGIKLAELEPPVE